MQRKVILEGNGNEVLIDSIYDDCIIAAYTEGDGHALIITTVDDGYRTVWLYTDQMQNYNYEGKDLKEIVKEMIHDGFNVFQFDDEDEFANWLIRMVGAKPPRSDAPDELFTRP